MGRVSDRESENILHVGDRSRDGSLEIIGKDWDHNGTLMVTVRDREGRGGAYEAVRRVRRFARRAIMYPEKTRSSRFIDVTLGERTALAPAGEMIWTIAVSRNRTN